MKRGFLHMDEKGGDMQETVTTPRSDFSVKYRGGYLAGSRGRRGRKGDFWGCTCVNCGQMFPNRRKLKSHYTECQQFEDSPETRREVNVTINDFNCLKCGKSFSGAVSLKHHNQRCWKYEDDQQEHQQTYTDIERNKTEKDGDYNHDVIVIEDENELKNEQAVVVAANELKSESDKESTNYNGKCWQVMTPLEENAVQVNGELDDVIGRRNMDKTANSTNTVMISEHVRNSVKIKTELLKEPKTTKQIKRRYDVMLSTTSDDSHAEFKKLKTAGTSLYKTLRDDILQEEQHDIFDRNSTNQKSHKCPQCHVRFKYKHKFDIHVKYAHVPMGMFIEKTLTTENGVPKKSSGTNKLNRHKVSTDRKNVKNVQQVTSSANVTSSVPLMANYPCDFCQLSFRHNSRYQRHLKSAHGEQQKGQVEFLKIFRCSECNERMSDKYSLLKHYKDIHVQKKIVSTEDEKEADENVNNVLDVNDIMKHLRRNLLCLQDDKIIERERRKSTEASVNLEDASELSNGSDGKSERHSESRDSDLALIKESEHKSEAKLQEKDNIARKTKSNVFHYYPLTYEDTTSRNYNDRKETYTEDFGLNQTTSYENGENSNDKPLDLSLKLEKPEAKTYVSSLDTTGEKLTVIDRKPSEYEKALLAEYYKDFLQEYGSK